MKSRRTKGSAGTQKGCDFHALPPPLQVPSFCSDAGDIDCRLEDLTKKYCIEYNYDYENGFAIGNGIMERWWGAG